MKNICIILLSIPLAGCVGFGPPGSRNVDPVSYATERPTVEIQSPTNYVASFFKKDLHRTQFETQADYDSRIHALQPTGEKVFLQVDQGLVHYVYNADKQVLTVILPPEVVTGQDFTSGTLRRQVDTASRFTVGRTINDLGTTPMQNGFGAKADVTYFDEKTYELNVINYIELPLNLRWRENAQSYAVGIGLAVPMPGAQAEALVKCKCVTLILGIAVGDLHHAGHYSVPITPTIQSPVGAEDDIYEIPARITHMKVYNTETGLVMASWTTQPPSATTALSH